jgi:hypothetical protein
MLTVMGYGYEVLGGILIFYSSAVTETSMPEDRKRVGHWIMFGALAVVYIAFGIGLRYVEVQHNAESSQRSDEDRRELRKNRQLTDERMVSVISSEQATFLQIVSLSSDIARMRSSLIQTIYKNDPHQVSELEGKAQAAQLKADTLSHELLAITMAPQLASQLRDWERERLAQQQDLHNKEWEDQIHIGGEHASQAETTQKVQKLMEQWQVEYDKKDQEYLEKLKGIITTADFVRRELLQRLPPQESNSQYDKYHEQLFVKALSDPLALSRKEAADYLESLARRVPSPK